jgi:hypothetical protein
MQLSINRGRPFGDERWQARTARKVELEFSLRDLGRPKKTGEIRYTRTPTPFSSLEHQARPTEGSRFLRQTT